MNKILNKVNRGKLREFLGDIDGHVILNPVHFTKVLGFPENFVQKFTRTHKSDGSFKGTIFGKDGKVINKLTGVDELDFVSGLAREVKADTSVGDRCLGRGFAARSYAQAIVKKLGEDWFKS